MPTYEVTFPNYPYYGGPAGNPTGTRNPLYDPSHPQGTYYYVPGSSTQVDWGRGPVGGQQQYPGQGALPPANFGGPQTPGSNLGGGGGVPGDYNPTYDPYGGGGYDYGSGQNYGGGRGYGGSSSNTSGNFQFTSIIPAIASLVQGFINNKSQNKANDQNQQNVEDRIRQALAQLSPEAIQSLSKVLLPQIMATANPMTQTALSALASSQARRGIYNSQFGAAQETGLRGQQANAASTQAFQGALNLAGQRAGVLTGLPIPQVQPNYNLGNGLYNAASLFTQGLALGRNPYSQLGQTQRQAPDPYKVPGQFQTWE